MCVYLCVEDERQGVNVDRDVIKGIYIWMYIYILDTCKSIHDI
jgi:hypothetical protein